MDADRNLLFGVLALQADFIGPAEFVKACAIWATRKDVMLGDLLVELGWISSADKVELDRLLAKKVRTHRGDLRAELAAVPDELRRSLGALGDADIQHSLAGLPGPSHSSLASTLDSLPETGGRYTLTRLHATGGIGRVWVARDNEIGREVALKDLRPERGADRRHWRRFLQEARITGQLEHPGIVPVYQLSRRADGSCPFYTMRFVAGRTLSEEAKLYHQTRVAGKADSLALLHLLNAFVVVCNTVAYAHSRHVLHRDLKPQNVVLGSFGEVFVLDWGLAKVLESDDEQARTPALAFVEDERVGRDHTVVGQALGTPAYMAPEQAAGRIDLIDYRTDVYGLGAILYEILTGRAPFADSDGRQLLQRLQEVEPTPPRKIWSDAPPALEAVCLRALSKEPSRRFSSAIELAHKVQHWQETQRREAEEERDRFFSLSFSMQCVAGFDGYFKLLNPRWQEVLGWTAEELMAHPYMDFVHPDDVASTTTEAADVAQGAATIMFENRYRCKDGSYKWLLWTAMPAVDQERTYATAMDISERKRTEAALRDSEERYRSVISAMQDGIVLLDADGEIRACNASAERILGLSSDQLIGRATVDPRWQSIHEDGTPFPGDTYPAMVTLRTGQPCFDVVMGVRKPNGELTWISINSQPLIRAGDQAPHGVVAVFRDVTDRRRTEEELKRTAAELQRCRRQLKSLGKRAAK